MIDAPKIIRDYLAAQAGLTALTGTRIYAEVDTPPTPGYTPDDGGAVCFKIRGGSVDYTAAILKASVQFKCYGATEVAANQVYRALHDALDEAAAGTFKSAIQENLGQTLQEPDTGWYFTLVFFTVMVIDA